MSNKNITTGLIPKLNGIKIVHNPFLPERTVIVSSDINELLCKEDSPHTIVFKKRK